MKTTIKCFCFTIFLFALVSCRENTPNEETVPEVEELSDEDTNEIDNAQDTIPEQLTVMVIPCSNGYDYNLKMGDLNPSLENYLGQDDRIILKPFPLKEMQGSGYFGVFDKKHCEKILEKVDVDYLIMTRMRGLDFSPASTEANNWGYDTKVLDVESMDQFNGIYARKLKSFELIDSDIKSKTDELIDMILESRAE